MISEIEIITRKEIKNFLRWLLQFNIDFNLNENDVFLISTALVITDAPEKYINKEKIFISGGTSGAGNGSHFFYKLTIGTNEIGVSSYGWECDYEGRYNEGGYSFYFPPKEEESSIDPNYLSSSYVIIFFYELFLLINLVISSVFFCFF